MVCEPFFVESLNLNYTDILRFWFDEVKPEQWFLKDQDFDEHIRKRFSLDVERALENRLESWAESMEGMLSLILLLDQFTRNIFRNQPKAFSGDEMALSLTLKAIISGCLDIQEASWRHFFLMPMMHSENLAIQEMSLPLFKKYTNNKTFSFAKKHHDIIKSFNRFPHRNKILGRLSSSEEISFLQKPGSSF